MLENHKEIIEYFRYEPRSHHRNNLGVPKFPFMKQTQRIDAPVKRSGSRSLQWSLVCSYRWGAFKALDTIALASSSRALITIDDRYKPSWYSLCSLSLGSSSILKTWHDYSSGFPRLNPDWYCENLSTISSDRVAAVKVLIYESAITSLWNQCMKHFSFMTMDLSERSEFRKQLGSHQSLSEPYIQCEPLLACLWDFEISFKSSSLGARGWTGNLLHVAWYM